MTTPLRNVSSIGVGGGFSKARCVKMCFTKPVEDTKNATTTLTMLLNSGVEHTVNVSTFGPVSSRVRECMRRIRLCRSRIAGLRCSPAPRRIEFTTGRVPMRISKRRASGMRMSRHSLRHIRAGGVHNKTLLTVMRKIVRGSGGVGGVSGGLNLS